jgi:arylsulfatase
MIPKSLAILTLLVAPVASAAAPDVLLVMPDQMRGDCLSALGHPVLHTPTLDRLAREGVLFRRAYSTVPSCIPARYALLTGLSPQASGVVGFASRKIRRPTLPEMLTAAGYRTILVGRTMHQNPPNRSLGFGREVLGSTYVDDDEYDRYLKQAAPDTGGIRKLVLGAGLDFNAWPAAPWPAAENLHPTTWAIGAARKALADAPADRPLFLTASCYAPHPPLTPPRKYFDAILARSLPTPAHGDWVEWSKLTTEGNKARDRVRLEGETLRRAQAGYFGLIEQLDTELAPLLAGFRARSEKAGRPWIIIFTSDHGEMLGDHGYFRKCEPYEGSANIPLVIVGSKGLGFQPGVRRNHLAALEDIMPTLAAVAAAKDAPPMDGVNLLPALGDAKQPTRALLHCEHAPCYNRQQAFHSLTDGHVKYIWRPADGNEQLFDLDRDPREERDLARVAAEHQRLLAWRARLVHTLAPRAEGFSDGHRLIPGRPYPAIGKGLGVGG